MGQWQCKPILIMIEMLTQNPASSRCCYCAKHRLVQFMPFSMVDLRSIKTNKHVSSLFWMILDVDVHLVNSVIVRVFTTDKKCTDWNLVTITTECNAEYQSKHNLQLPYKFDGRINYWNVSVTFDLTIVFWIFLGNYMILGFSFLKKTFKKLLSIILSIPILEFYGGVYLQVSGTPSCLHIILSNRGPMPSSPLDFVASRPHSRSHTSCTATTS